MTTINGLRGSDTRNWIVGFNNNTDICVLCSCSECYPADYPLKEELSNNEDSVSGEYLAENEFVMADEYNWVVMADEKEPDWFKNCRMVVTNPGYPFEKLQALECALKRDYPDLAYIAEKIGQLGMFCANPANFRKPRMPE
jgi:hypothetical protein